MTSNEKLIELMTELLHENRQTNKWLESLELQGERNIAAQNKLVQLIRDMNEAQKAAK